jgi:O-antigen/teichoic acid export membrane protein
MGGHFKNATWSGAVTGFRALSGLANALLAVRLVGVESYGHLAALLSVFVLYLSLNTSLYTVLVTRLMSPAIVDDPRARSEILASTALLTASALVLLILMTGTAFWITPSFLGWIKHEDMGLAFLMMGALVAVQILAALQAAIIEASGRLDLAMKAQLFGPFVLLIMLCSSYLLHLSLTAQDYVIMLCTAACVDLGLLWIVRRTRLRLVVLQAGASASLARLKELLRSGGVLQATSLMNLFLEPLNKLLLNHFIGPVAVTTYDLAMKVIWGIQGLFGAAMRVFLHLAHQDGAAVSQTYTRVITLVAVPALVMHTVGAILLSWVAHRWVDIEASQLMLFYAIATLSNLGMIFVTPLYTSLISRGDLRFIFHSQAILALSNTFISIVAIPFLGLVGAAIGLLAATIYNVLAIYFRHGSQVGRIASMASTFKSVAARFIVTGTLFAATLYLGTHGELGTLWSLVLLIGLCVIGITEPLPRRLLGDALQIAMPTIKGRK